MREGEIVGGRFRLMERVGAGGSGEVFRAWDLQENQPAACKVLSRGADSMAERLVQEAEVLGQLSHPGIVRSLAHGALGDGRPFLALEWLEGEALEAALERGPLPPATAVEVVRQAAEALGCAHRRGLVHGDVTPANLMLLSGKPERIKLIDFGSAWLWAAERGEELWGTPGYMAPEQAGGLGGVDARADVFSLGCVLFRCLSGRGPFVGANVAAVLAKVLLEPVPAPSALGAAVPPALDRLLGRMLAKAPEGRPADGDEVARELGALSMAAPSAPLPSLTRSERRAVTLLLLSPAAGAEAESEPRSRGGAQATGEEADVLRGAAQVRRLRQGSWLAVFDDRGRAAAERAGRAALALRERWPERGVVVATGRAGSGAGAPVSDAIDRAVALLPAATGASARGPLVDEATAGLLAARFALTEADGGLWLLGLRQGIGSLLGRPSPFVGRRAEAMALRDAARRSADERAPRAALVLGEAGAGKSRLAYEWLAGLGEGACVWVARGDPLAAGSPFGLVGQILRQASGLRDGDPLEARRRRLTERVEQAVAPEHVERVAEFLGALVGVPFVGSVQLRAAREDPVLLGDQMLRAWEDWLEGEGRRRPLVLVFDDLQWGDLPSVRYLDAVLRTLRATPLLVVGLARPEVDELFPGLWSERGVLRLRLGPLAVPEGLGLARGVLGGKVPEHEFVPLVERAGGNPFCLEELLRARARGAVGDQPATALAMLEARLGELSAEGRRALRAASCFGQVFWRGGVAELLGGVDPQASLRELLAEELIVRRDVSRFLGEEEYVFRQALVREAAYATLTGGDLCLGHALAGRWLERNGEGDAAVLAEHFERGDDAARAGGFFRLAAEQALGGNDLDASIDRAERGLRAGARGALAGELRLLQAEAYLWRGELDLAELCGAEALELLSPGAASWYIAAGVVVSVCARLGRSARVVELSLLLHASPSQPPLDARRVALAQASLHLLFAGHQRLARAIISDLLAGASNDDSPAVAAWLCRARAQLATSDGDTQGGLAWSEQAVACYRRAGDLRNAASQLANAGSGLNEVGRYRQAEQMLREAAALAERLGARPGLATAWLNLGLSLAFQGKLDEAAEAERQAIAELSAMGHRRLALGARAYLARILLLRGDRAEALALAHDASVALDDSPNEQAVALTALSLAHLASGDASQALATSRAAVRLLGSLGHLDEGESALHLAHARALLASGLLDEARAAAHLGRDRLLRRAATLQDPSVLHDFLHAAVDNAALLALAARLDS